MTGPMWAALVVATLTLAAGLAAAVRTARRGQWPRWWPVAARPAPSLAHQWASQALEPRTGRHVRLGRTGRLLIAAACGIALVAVGSVVTLAVTAGERAPDRFTVALSGQSADDVGYGPRIVSEDAALCLAARADADGSALTLAPCDGSPTQRFTPATDGTIRLGPRCLTLTKDVSVEVAPCGGGPDQRFSAESGRLATKAGACVDVADGRVVVDAGIVLRNCDDITARDWWYLAS
ncbi:RICIN domain-containing protein [Actinoplanes sp. NPDC049681]|uniref:RICIN domain-containing protein n=1 Tax=Actinoplanes sp. NPDC049681 TaxID=3363905 RepID=UPI00379984CE